MLSTAGSKIGESIFCSVPSNWENRSFFVGSGDCINSSCIFNGVLAVRWSVFKQSAKGDSYLGRTSSQLPAFLFEKFRWFTRFWGVHVKILFCMYVCYLNYVILTNILLPSLVLNVFKFIIAQTKILNRSLLCTRHSRNAVRSLPRIVLGLIRNLNIWS